MHLLGSLATWYFWAYYAAGLFIMGSVLALHLYHTKMAGWEPWLVVAGAFCGVFGSVIGGIQAGPLPLLTAEHGVALIRGLWVTGITLGIVASGLYLFGMREKQEGE